MKTEERSISRRRTTEGDIGSIVIVSVLEAHSGKGKGDPALVQPLSTLCLVPLTGDGVRWPTRF
jgi:hypothetical protein